MSTVIFVVTLNTIVAVILITVAGIYHAEINNYVSHSQEDISYVPSVAIGIGIYIFFLMGYYLCQCRCNKGGYIVMCVIFLTVLLGSSIYGILKLTDMSGVLKKTIEQDMNDSFTRYTATNNTIFVQDLFRIQQKLMCCGLNSSDDYNIDLLPISCCPESHLTNETFCIDKTKRFNDGCVSRVYNIVKGDTIIVAFVFIGLTIIQILATLCIIMGYKYSLTESNTSGTNDVDFVWH